MLLSSPSEIENQNKRIEEKQDDILREIAKVKENERLSAELSQHLQKLHEELARKKERKSRPPVAAAPRV